MNQFELKNRLCIEDYRIIEEKLNLLRRHIAKDNIVVLNKIEDLRDELRRNSELHEGQKGNKKNQAPSNTKLSTSTDGRHR